MFTFFRRIRKGLLGGNRTSKYLLYAVGEILLVMIGILLALQVNNWNQDRIDRVNEGEIRRLLHAEFKENKIAFQQVLDGNLHRLEQINRAIALFPIEPDSANLNEISLNIPGVFGGFRTFNPSNAVIDGITSNNAFDLITDVELRSQILAWSGFLEDYLEDEKSVSSFLELVATPYLIQHGLFTDKGTLDERLDMRLLSSPEFESLVFRYRQLLRRITNDSNPETFPEVKNLQQVIDEIIEMTSPNGN